MRNLLFLLIIVSIWSCNTLETNHSNEVKNPLESIVLLDTFSNKLKLDTASRMTRADFYPMYIGKKQDTILLNYRVVNIQNINHPTSNYRHPDSSDLKIFVDTSQHIGSAVPFFRLPPLPNFKTDFKFKDRLRRGNFKSYPVIIKNNTSDTLIVGAGKYVRLVIEAIDSTGNWKPIQRLYRHFAVQV